MEMKRFLIFVAFVALLSTFCNAQHEEITCHYTSSQKILTGIEFSPNGQSNTPRVNASKS